MIDHQRTIDNIRSILASAGPMSEDDIWSVAVEYAEACESANERLRKCGQLLREGLRSEAIHQCEAEPNLLNLVTTLDFPEVLSWVEMLQSNGLSPPNSLLVDVAADLNEAYAQEQPLAALLRRHRLLALSYSPLRDRISTMRKLSRLDGNNPVWKEDLRTFEQARQQEIRRTAEAEYKQGNLTALAELTQDVTSGDWLEPPPAVLVREIAETHERLRRKCAQAELEELEPLLNDAFSQFDVARGRTLRERWQSAAAVVDLGETDPLAERAAPAIEWLAAQDRDAASEAGYQTAVAELEQALERDDTTLSEFERLAHAVIRFERPIPPRVEQRLRTRIMALQLSRTRTMRLIVSGVAAVFVLAAGGVAYALLSHRHTQQVASHLDTLQSLLEQRHFDEAQKHLDQLAATSPAVAADAQIQAVSVALTQKKREELTRLDKFSTAIESAEQSGAEQPNRGALAAARGLALLDAEKARVVKLESAIAAVERREQAQRDQAFVDRVKTLKVGLADLNRDHPDEKKLGEIRQAVAELLTGEANISKPIYAQGEVLQAAVQGFYKTIQRQQEMTSTLQTVEQRVGDAVHYKEALEQVVAQFPESPQAVDFKRAAAEAPLWSGVAAWNRFLADWQATNVARLEPAKAREKVEECNRMVREYEDYPAVAAVRKRIPHFEAIARRTDESGVKLIASLNELFTDPLMAGLWMVETADERGRKDRYYLIAPPPVPGETQTSIQIAYILDFSRNAAKKKSIPLDIIKYKGPAPQSVIAKSALDAFSKMDQTNWETAFMRIIGSIFADQQLDPILKAILLQRVLEVACQGSESLRAAFAQTQEVLKSVAIDPAVPWMDQDNEDTRRTTALASDLVNRLPPLQEVRQLAAAAYKEFTSPPDKQYEWVGWLSRDKDSKWQCSIKEPQADAALFVAEPSGKEKGMRWAQVGRVRGGKVEFELSDTSPLVQGRPVFVQKPVK